MVAEGVYPIWADGRVVGCLGVAFKFGDFFNPRELLFSGGGTYKLVSQSGRILSSDSDFGTDISLFSYGFPDYDQLTGAMSRNENYFIETRSPVSGYKSFICMLPLNLQIGDEDIFLYLDIPLDQLYAGANKNLKLVYSIAGFGIILLLLCVFAATRSIVRPIRDLTDNFQRISSGDLQISGHHQGDDKVARVVELDILHKSLWKMLEQVNLNHALTLKATEERVEKEKVMASSEAKSNFFANMSHEIRTPMNAILGIAEIMLNDEPLSPRQAAYVKDIRESSESLLSIINDILDMAKLESGKLELSPIDYSLPKMLAAIRSIAGYLAENNGLTFVYEEAGDLPDCLFGDNLRLRQVLLNLLSNAVKFTREGSVTLKVTAGEGEMIFQVADQGIGIHPEDLASLFKPFKQTDIMRNRDIKGTGLGLSISRNLVGLMGGRISVESEYGRGSTFSVSLPQVLGNHEKLPPEVDCAPYTYDPRTRVMVVDDNAVNLTVAAGLLKAIFGLEADRVLSGREAVEKADKISYDLIFMDHMMPEMDGVEAARRIRALRPEYEKLPIVALTANAVRGAREMMLSSGIDDFLSKPIVKKDLAAVLYKWLPEKYRREARDQCAPEPQYASVPLTEAFWPLEVLMEIDLAAGLRFVAGQREVYDEMLTLAAADFPRKAAGLSSLSAEENWADLAIEVHGLKSSLASLGAGELSALAKNLEAAALKGEADYCREHIQAFLKRLEVLGREINEALAGREGAQGQEAEGRRPAFRLNEHLRRLHRALIVYDYEVIMESLKEAAAEARGQDREILGEIKKMMRRFDYHGAAEKLGRMVEYPA